MPLIAHKAIPVLSAAYPDAPAMLRHYLAEHPLFGLEALSQVASELAPQWVERRVHDAGNGEDFTLIGHGDAARLIAENGLNDQWIMLRRIEQLPDYHTLLHSLINELGDAITNGTGDPSDIKGFIFVSAPRTHTPFHFDAEFNILFQISGTKTFATYPARPPFVGLAEREAYHLRGDNMLGWRSDFASAAKVHTLAPGDAVFVPHGAPHWVKVGPEPSISLSLTWQNRWSEQLADALAINPLLRRLRLPMGDPARLNGAPRWRSVASRIAQKAGIL